MNKWLQGFAYRIHVSWWMFGVAGIITVMIALLTVSSQAIRAAVTNPVKSLRSNKRNAQSVKRKANLKLELSICVNEKITFANNIWEMISILQHVALRFTL